MISQARRAFELCPVSMWIFACGLAWGCHRSPTDPVAEEKPADPPWFVETTEEAGLKFVHDAGPAGGFFMPQIVGSGAALFDFNNDGLLDILILQNGGPRSRATNRLFQQLPGGRFKDVSAGSGLDLAGHFMGTAIGDVNNDGWPDVLVTGYGGTRLFLNNGNGTFRDVTEEAALHNPAWGTSAAFLDFDRDGWLDLVVVNYVDYDPSWPCTAPSGKREYCSPKVFPGRASRLWRNLGRSGLKGRGVRFQDVTVSSGLGRMTGPGLGVLCADFNGDGWPDIFIANDGQPNRLWINRHDGTFSEEAITRGVAYNGLGQAWANMGSALGDVDGDGLPDLFVTHLTEETNTLWKQGPRGLFVDRTASSGLASPRWRGTGFGTVMGDFDQDGALDIAVVNGRVARGSPPGCAALGPHYGLYAERNQLFANDGKGHFLDISTRNPAFALPMIGRGLACGDIDGDGALDLLVTSVAGPARLYRNVVPQRGHWLSIRALDPALRRDAYGAEIMVEAGQRRWTRSINPAHSYLCSSDARAHFGLGLAERVNAIHVLWPDGTKETFPGGPADRKIEIRKGEGKPEGK